MILGEKMEKKLREYDVIIEQDENKVYVASVPALLAATEGDTIEELMENIKEELSCILNVHKKTPKGL